MIVYDLHLVRFAFNPSETDAILVVDANTVPAFPLTLENLQLVAGWDPQLLQRAYGVELIELSPGHAPQALGTGMPGVRCVSTIEHVFRPGISERPYHDNMIARNPC
jgi:hypothetical protein